MAKKDIFQNLATIQKLEFKYNKEIIKMKNISEFAKYLPQYRYNPEKDVIIDIKEGVIYYIQEGFLYQKLVKDYYQDLGLILVGRTLKK